MDCITISAAARAGLKTYYTGKPCKRGHLALRFVSSGNCVECSREASRISGKKYYAANKAHCLAVRHQWRLANPVRMKELLAVNSRSWRISHKGRATAHAAKRRSAKLLRTPRWADMEKIRLFYDACPSGMVVDHVIPLQGALVSGLHVEYNLQYLTRSQNAAKKNRFPLEVPC